MAAADGQSLEELMFEGKEISEELRIKLSKVKIKINRITQGDVINAIREVFGEETISSAGNVYITYDMYCSCLNLMRSLGAQIAEGYIK